MHVELECWSPKGCGQQGSPLGSTPALETVARIRSSRKFKKKKWTNQIMTERGNRALNPEWVSRYICSLWQLVSHKKKFSQIHPFTYSGSRALAHQRQDKHLGLRFRPRVWVISWVACTISGFTSRKENNLGQKQRLVVEISTTHSTRPGWHNTGITRQRLRWIIKPTR